MTVEERSSLNGTPEVTEQSVEVLAASTLQFFLDAYICAFFHWVMSSTIQVIIHLFVTT